MTLTVLRGRSEKVAWGVEFEGTTRLFWGSDDEDDDDNDDGDYDDDDDYDDYVDDDDDEMMMIKWRWCTYQIALLCLCFWEMVDSQIPFGESPEIPFWR